MLNPKVLWAQTKENLFLTVDIQDITNLSVDLKEDYLNVTASKQDVKYGFTLNFLHPINVEESKYTNFRNLKFNIVKKESGSWPTLQSGPKLHWVQCDWDKWIDSDDEEAMGARGMGQDFDFGGDMSEGDSDDEGMGGLDGSNFDPSQFANMKGMNFDEMDQAPAM